MSMQEWIQILERLQVLVVGIPALIAAFGVIWAWIRARAQELAAAREDSWWQAGAYLWQLGQRIKKELDSSGKSRGALPGRLRELAPGVLLKFA